MRTVSLCLLVAAAPLCGQRAHVPSDAELAAAQPRAAQALGQRLIGALQGDVDRGVGEVLAAAFAADDDAASYVLWQQAVDLAVRNGRLALALTAERVLATRFGLDPEARGTALLQRLAAPDAGAQRLAAIAFVGLGAAGQFAVGDAEAAMLAYYDVALRSALRCGHPQVFEHVRDQLAALRAPRELAARLTFEQVQRGVGAWFPRALQQGELAALAPFAVGDLAPWFEPVPGIAAECDLASLTAEQWLALAAHTADATLRTGCLRCASEVLLARYATADDTERPAVAHDLAVACERLATVDGLTRLRFRDARHRERLVYANGDWRIEDGVLHGRSTGANNFATHRVRFGRIRTVVIRGGIAGEAGLNFRCKVGDVNLLLNWEVEPQNHLWLRGECHRSTPRALTAGQEHEILICSDGVRCHVAIDGRQWWTVPAALAGTVSVYPALGSEIFVREILIDGEPDGLVDGPVGTLM